MLGDVPTKICLKKSLDMSTLFQQWRIKPVKQGWQEKTSLKSPLLNNNELCMTNNRQSHILQTPSKKK